MPLMVYIGAKGQTRRSDEARGNRKVKQELRGYPRERIEAMKKGEKWSARGRGRGSGRGRGATSWQDWGEIPGNDWAGGRSSSSNQAPNDPSRTASQEEWGWNTDWSSKNNWAWKQ